VTKAVIVDTGPLVALFDRRDQWHPWVIETVGTIPAPMFTCEAVLTEACYLLRHAFGSADALLEALDRRAISLRFTLEDELPNVRHLLKRYSNVPMSLADACLVRMSEIIANGEIFTLDRDFGTYRKNGRQAIAVIAPFA
jgi:predicted nucleic acid-binding protein